MPSSVSPTPVVKVPYDLVPGTNFAGMKFENDLANLEFAVQHINALYALIDELKARLLAAGIP